MYFSPQFYDMAIEPAAGLNGDTMLTIVKTSLVFLAVLLLSTTINADSYSLIKVKPETKQQFLEMASLGMEIIQATNTEIEAVAEAEDLIFLENAGIPFDFVHTNLRVL